MSKENPFLYRQQYNERHRLKKIQFIEEITQLDLSLFYKNQIPPEQIKNNIENHIGDFPVPLGLAGPLQERETGKLSYIPLATTEGALVSSVNRGIKAITLSGGFYSHVVKDIMIRAPIFLFDTMKEAIGFTHWIDLSYHEIKYQFELGTTHGKLTEIEPILMGNRVHLRFIINSGNASGQNMVSVCTELACQWIINNFHSEIRKYYIEANFSSDKKASMISLLKGRGVEVIAECILKEEIISRYLKTSSDRLLMLYNNFIASSISSGMLGFNINVSNLIAAVYIPTGQDIACVHESSISQIFMEKQKDGLYVSMRLPCLIVGTVGGGTGLPHARTMLELMGCANDVNSKHQLAKIIAAAAIGLDISTLSAIESNDFVKAHKTYGRNPPERKTHFIKILEHALSEQEKMAINITRNLPIDSFDSNESILSKNTCQSEEKKKGLFAYHLILNKNNEEYKIKAIIKSKNQDNEVIKMLTELLHSASLDKNIPSGYHLSQIEFKGLNTKEISLFKLQNKHQCFAEIMPKFYGHYIDHCDSIFMLIEEYIGGYDLLNSVDNIKLWTDNYISAAIEGITDIHALYYNNHQQILLDLDNAAFPCLTKQIDYYSETASLWNGILESLTANPLPFMTADDISLHRKILYSIQDWSPQLLQMPMTLIHNDFNPRNIAFKTDENKKKLCVYDWELAKWSLPQHDIAELLVFILQQNDEFEYLIGKYIEQHRLQLEHQIDSDIESDEWKYGTLLALYDLLINRVALYVISHRVLNYTFTERIYKNLMRAIRALETDCL